MTFQRLAALLRAHPDKLLITGEDRFLGYSIMLGRRAALIGMGAALPDLQAGLLRAYADGDWAGFSRCSDALRPARRGDVHPADGGLRPPDALGRRGRRRAAGGRVRRPLGAGAPARRARRGRARGARCARGSRVTSSGSAARCRRDAAAYVREAYGIDLTARYLGYDDSASRSARARASSRSTPISSRPTARPASPSSCSRPSSPRTPAGERSMGAWAIHETRMKVERRQAAGGRDGWTVTWKGRGWDRSFERLPRAGPCRRRPDPRGRAARGAVGQVPSAAAG